MLNINARERLAELEAKELAEQNNDKERSKFIYKIPEENNPLICKFIVDPRSGERFVPMVYFKHKIGPSDQDVRTHVSLASINRGKAPENEFYWENKKKLSVLKKAGKGDSEEARKLDALVKAFAPKNGGYMYITQPDNSDVKVLKLNTMLLNEIFGREKTDYYPEIRGVISEGRETGVSPYYLDRLDGWVKIWKSGSGLNTRYFVQYHQIDTEVETKTGKKIKVKEMAEIQAHPKVLATYLGEKESEQGFLSMDDFPDVVEREAKYAWTEAESNRFVEGFGSISSVPDRVLRRQQKDETDEASAPASGDPKKSSVNSAGTNDRVVAQTDELPF